MIGEHIAQYTILEKLGEGGMGVVYKAEDNKLDRLVALKFLPAHLNASELDKARFIQEAKAAAALNHPNVCSIIDIQEHEVVSSAGAPAGKRLFIVMEFVDGQTLREKKGSIAYKQAIDIGIQIADGLAAAHEKGIIHRDIKPDNIMIRKDGIAQIMDFGLAKLRASGSKITRLTKEGSTIGTAGYMSPEQVQGQETDHRSDIFSYGVVLFELLTGQLPFKGVHETAMAYEIVNVDPPPLSSVKPDIDPNIDALVLDCLEKDPRERTQSIAQVGLDLKRFRRESSRQRVSRITAARPVERLNASGGSGEAPPGSRRTFVWPALTLFFAVTTSLVLWSPWRSTEITTPAVLRIPINLPLTTPLVGGASSVAISPDGKYLVYLANSGGTQKLFLRPFDRLSAQPISGTETASDPFFSPDGQWIAFFANGRLRKVSIYGGSAQDVCTIPGYMRGGWWTPDNYMWFGLINGPIYRVHAGGGEIDTMSKIDSTGGEISHRFPQVLPDGKTVIYTIKQNNIVSFDDAIIAAENIATHERKILIRGGSYARYLPTGYIMYARGSSLYAVQFDPVRVETKGAPLPVEEGGMLNPLSGDANYGFSNSGMLVYVPRGSNSGIDATLKWMDRSTGLTTLLDSTGAYGNGRISPDGQRLAIVIRAANDDIWMYQMGRGTMTRITFGGGNSDYPIWTPDGKSIIYQSERGRRVSLFSKLWDGSGAAEKLDESVNADIFSCETVSPDGKYVVFAQEGDIWILGLHDHTAPKRIMTSPSIESNPAVSPDGRWLSYISNESGQGELYVVPFPPGEGKYQISTNGANDARWLADGKTLLYTSSKSIMEVDVTLSPSFDFSRPKKVLELPQSWNNFWDVTPDGNRFVVGLTKSSELQEAQVNLVVGWFSEMKNKFGSGGK